MTHIKIPKWDNARYVENQNEFFDGYDYENIPPDGARCLVKDQDVMFVGVFSAEWPYSFVCEFNDEFAILDDKMEWVIIDE